MSTPNNMATATKVVKLVQRLVKSMLPSITHNERKVASMNQYILQIVGSYLSPPSLLITEHAVEQSLKQSRTL